MRLFPPDKIAQAPIYAYLMSMHKVWDTASPGLMLIAALAACVRVEPRPLSPDQITSNCESRVINNPKRKEILETNLNPKFVNWPASSGDFSRLTLAALYHHPDLDVARAKYISINTK